MHVLDFSLSNFLLLAHILSSGEAFLRALPWVPILISSFSTLCQQNVPSNFFQTSSGDIIDYFEYFEGP